MLTMLQNLQNRFSLGHVLPNPSEPRHEICDPLNRLRALPIESCRFLFKDRIIVGSQLSHTARTGIRLISLSICFSNSVSRAIISYVDNQHANPRLKKYAYS